MGCGQGKEQQKAGHGASQHHHKNNEHFTKSQKSKLDTIFASTCIQQTYEFKKKLGSGSYGTVLSAHLKGDESAIVAVKSIDKTHKKVKGKEYVLIKEIAILKTLDHPNIIKFYEVFNDTKYFYICQEFCSGGDLFQKLTEQKRLKEKEVAQIIEQVLQALAHCHAKGVVHRDIKPDNILYSSKEENAEIKLIDFGLSSKIAKPNSLDSLVGTPYYVAPEILNEDVAYGRACDLWSVGVMIYVMLVGFPPFDADSKEDLFDNIANKRMTVQLHEPEWKKFTKEVKDFIDKLLVVNPSKRLTAQQALAHDWFVKAGLRTVNQQSFQSTHSVRIEDHEEEQILEKLKTFKMKNKFHQEVMSVFVHHLEEKEIHELKLIFQEIDKDNTGLIKPSELSEALKQHGKEVSQKELIEIFKNVSPEKDEKDLTIKYTDFIKATLEKKDVFTEHKLWTMFKYFDSSNNDIITFEDLVQVHRRNGDQVDEEEIKQIVLKADPAHKGNIDFECFKKIMGYKKEMEKE